MKLDFTIDSNNFDMAGEASSTVKRTLAKLGVSPPAVKRAAVAELDEASCIIVPQGISIEEATLEKAREKDIAGLSTKIGTYEICWRLHEVL